MSSPDYIGPNRATLAPTPDAVIVAAAEMFDVSPEQIVSGDRTPRLIDVRHIAMAAADLVCARGPRELAHAFDRDRSTLVHALAKVRRDPEMCELAGRVARRARHPVETSQDVALKMVANLVPVVADLAAAVDRIERRLEESVNGA